MKQLQIVAGSNLGKVVDDLGRVKALIADLKSQEAALKQVLIDAGLDKIEGRQYQASISESCRLIVDSARLQDERPKVWEEYSRISCSINVRVSARSAR
jgi:hypothetical protein